MIVGLYEAGESPIHRLPAGAKLVLLAMISGVLLAADGVGSLGALTAMVIWATLSARLSFAALFRDLRPLLPFLVIIGAAQVWLADVTTAATVSIRMGLLVWTAIIVTRTTRLSDMADALTTAMTPLKIVGVRPAVLGFQIAIAVRLIPSVFDILREVREAQRARGLETSLVAVVVPTLVRAMKSGHDLAEAMDARGYPGDETS